MSRDGLAYERNCCIAAKSVFVWARSVQLRYLRAGVGASSCTQTQHRRIRRRRSASRKSLFVFFVSSLAGQYESSARTLDPSFQAMAKSDQDVLRQVHYKLPILTCVNLLLLLHSCFGSKLLLLIAEGSLVSCLCRPSIRCCKDCRWVMR